MRNACNLAVVQILQALQRSVRIGPWVDGGEHVVVCGAFRLCVRGVQAQLAVFFFLALGKIVAACLPEHERRKLTALGGQEGGLQLVGYDDYGFNIFVHAFFYLNAHCLSRHKCLFSSSRFEIL